VTRSITEIMKGSRLHCLTHQAVRAVVRRKDLRVWNRKAASTRPLHFAKEGVVREYASRFGPRIFVETGTYMGDMAHAVRDLFDRIITIELDGSFCKAARWRLRKLPHVTVMEGDSSRMLPEILQDLREPCLFWLDAHYSGWPTSKSDVDTPILRELDVLLAHGVRDHVVLIDDASCFTGQNDYPSVDEVRHFVRDRRPDVALEVADDIIRLHPTADVPAPAAAR
jgi:hypothetical protein